MKMSVRENSRSSAYSLSSTPVELEVMVVRVTFLLRLPITYKMQCPGFTPYFVHPKTKMFYVKFTLNIISLF